MTDFDNIPPGTGQADRACVDRSLHSPRSFAEWFDFAVRARVDVVADAAIPHGLDQKDGHDA